MRTRKKRPVRDTGSKSVDLTVLGFPEVPLVGCVRVLQARNPLRSHIHPGTYELCYLAEGMQVWSVGGREYLMRAGDIFLTLPDEPHGSGHHPREDRCLYWLQFRLPKRGRFLSLSQDASAALVSELRGLGERRLFAGKPLLRDLYQNVIDATLSYDMDSGAPGLKAVQVSTWLQSLFICVIRCAAETESPRRTNVMNDVLEYIEQHLEEPLQVPELAEVARLSTSHFKAKFRNEVGLPPARYLLRRRIAFARELLERGDYSVTEIAHRMGFSSSQNFATTFKRLTNQRPVDFLSRT